MVFRVCHMQTLSMIVFPNLSAQLFEIPRALYSCQLHTAQILWIFPSAFTDKQEIQFMCSAV